MSLIAMPIYDMEKIIMICIIIYGVCFICLCIRFGVIIERKKWLSRIERGILIVAEKIK